MQVHHFNLRQVVAQAGLEIIGIVCRGHLHRSGSKLRLRQFIRDDGNLAIHQRQQNFLSVQMRIALVARVHRDRRIPQHGLRPRGCDGDKFVRAGLGSRHRITNLPQLAGNLLVLHLEIRDRRLASRAPVHDVLAAINQPLLMQPDKHLAHRARKVLVHGEILAAPIHRRAQPPHLFLDSAAIMPLPLPHPLDKLFASQFGALLAFGGQLPLHHHLRGNAGVVSPGKPQRSVAPHAMPAHDDVHLRLVQHVPHVQPPGNIRRRQQQGKHRTRVSLGRRRSGKQLLLYPVLRPPRLNSRRLVGFGKLVRHRKTSSRQKNIS